MYEVVIFCIVVGMLMAAVFFAGGIIVGKSKDDPVPEIDDEADLLATKLHLIASTGALLSKSEDETLERAAAYILKLGERKDEGN